MASVRGPVLLSHWKFFVTLALPILFCPLLVVQDTMELNGEVVPSTKLRCAYVLILMASYWILDTLPLPITSLLPLFLFPLLGIEGSADVAKNYMKDAIVLFLGGLTIALAIEYSNLHRRIALSMIQLLGRSPEKVMLGNMAMTAFLSMWMSGTAATTLMIPIVTATMQSISKTDCDDPEAKRSGTSDKADYTAVEIKKCDGQGTDKDASIKTNDGLKQRRNLIYLLSTSYGALIGGVAVIVGTGPNLIFYEMTKSANISQGGKYLDVSFTTWTAYTVPATLLNLHIAWIYLYALSHGMPKCLTFWRRRKSQEASGSAEHVTKGSDASDATRAELESLGPMSFHESAVAFLFVAIVSLWILRDPRFIKGWGPLFDAVEVRDSAPAMLIVVLLFVIPKDPSFLVGKEPKKKGALLEWKYMQKNIPWGVIFLMGAGFAISDAFFKSHLAEWIGDHLIGLRHFSNEVIVIFVMLITSCFTELISNAACANIILPILLSLSERLNLHPLYLTLPATVCCSFAFMVPASAAPNAIAYAAAGEEARVVDMMRIGWFVKVFCVVVFFVMHVTYGDYIFNFSDYEYASPIKLSH